MPGVHVHVLVHVHARWLCPCTCPCPCHVHLCAMSMLILIFMFIFMFMFMFIHVQLLCHCTPKQNRSYGDAACQLMANSSWQCWYKCYEDAATVLLLLSWYCPFEMRKRTQVVTQLFNTSPLSLVSTSFNSRLTVHFRGQYHQKWLFYRKVFRS
jgi:hypothetical protein